MKRIILLFFLTLACTSLQAQFSLTGSDPAGVRWNKMDTPEFRIIFPEGEDSLARVYGRWLEKARIGVSRSSGLMTGEFYKRRMPVVLHSFSTVPNASVAWAPRRMDIFTAPDPYNPTPIPWEKLLAIHEGRHVAQMQAGTKGYLKSMHYVLGEMFAGSLAGIYPGPVLLEGDAVVTETALTNSGRGRQASFLSYMMPAFASGDWRDYWKWSYGSHKYYTPDYYKAGYMLISGVRVFFDDPLFTKEYFNRMAGSDLFFVLPKTIRSASGSGLKRTFQTIAESYDCIWSEEALHRGPFMPSARYSNPSWRHTAFSGSVFDEESGILSIRSGMTTPTSLVRVNPAGSVRTIRPFSSSSGDLFLDKANNRIWWSEAVPHWRWTLAGNSRIRYMDISDPSKIHDLTTDGRLYNPSVSPDGKSVCATEYLSTGGSRLVLMNTADGSVERIVNAPDSLQFTETAWVGDRLFAAGLSDSGMGIYPVGVVAEPVEAVEPPVLGPQPVELHHLRPFDSAQGNAFDSVQGQKLSFVSDRTGVSEMYVLDPDSGMLYQATSTRYGIIDPFLNPAADTLYYSSLAPSDNPEAYRQGSMIYSTAVHDLPMKEVSFGDIHPWKVADRLSAQEAELARDEDLLPEAAGLSLEPKGRFHKYLPIVHSWAPLYFNYDNVESISADTYYKTASLGATALFQNLVGDGYGFVGYGAHEDPNLDGSWRHSAHFKYSYTGLLPVIELSTDLGDRASMERMRVQRYDKDEKKESVYTSKNRKSTPFFESGFRVYLPVNLSSGGYSRGVVPQLKFSFNNDVINDRISLQEVVKEEDRTKWTETGSLGQNHTSMMYVIDISARGYVMREKAPSQAFPRYGIGAEAGFRARPGHKEFYSSTAYVYLYGYLPGILQDQGIKLSATFGTDLRKGRYSYPDMPVSFVPRGFVDTNIRSVVNTCSPGRMKFSVDYSLPLLNLDWSGICPVAYIKKLEITPFFDYSYHWFKDYGDFHINRNGVTREVLTSVGADLTLCLGNLLWLPYDTRIGIRCAYNSWNDIERLPVTGLSHNYIGGIISVAL